MKLRKHIKIENKEYAIIVQNRNDNDLTRQLYNNEVKYIVTLMCTTTLTCKFKVEHLILIDDAIAVNKAISDCMEYARIQAKHSCLDHNPPLTSVESSIKEMLLKLGFD